MGLLSEFIQMISEPIESYAEFVSMDGPYEENFDSVTTSEIFNCQPDTLVNAWFLCLVLSGNFNEATFNYDGREITVIHEGYLMLLQDEYKEEIAKEDLDPVKLYNYILRILQKTVNDCGYWPWDYYGFA